MIPEIKFSPSLVYRSFEEFNPKKLYLDLFQASKHADLLLGYFSTSAFISLKEAFAHFIVNGGRLRLIANDIISNSDRELFVKKYDDFHFSLESVKELVLYLSKNDKLFLRCLAFLIQENRLEIKFIRPKNGKGIAHFKSALFLDQNGNKALIKGSCNFSAYGFEENLEEAEVTLNWHGEQQQLKVLEFQDYFNEVWDDLSPNITHVLPQKIISEIRRYAGEVREDDLVKDIQREYHTKTKDGPHFPFESGPRAYQKQAYENWKANEFRGLFAMATGTGKTLTALNCVLEEYKISNRYRVFIFVPTNTLVDQWVEEANKFGFDNVFSHSNKKATNKKLFSTMLTLDLFSEQSFIYVMTYDSMVSTDFLNNFKTLMNKSTFIADEAHNVGAFNTKNKWLRILRDDTKVIALSATPERQFEDNMAFTLECFNDERPYTFEYSMAKAIENGILSNYEYFPQSVQLTSEEFKEFEKLTEKISYMMNMIDDEENKDQLEMLLLKRRRIVNNASNKFAVFDEVINQNFKDLGDLRYSLVYSPEGFDDANNDRRLYNYSRVIRDIDESITIRQFTGDSGSERDSILESFENGKIDVLISMKCLDEGVDIPRAEYGYFLSSTGNPRQFIQRRGRLLRKHRDKKFAKIFDFVVVPPENVFVSSAVRKIVSDELKRVKEFGLLAINSAEIINYIEELNNKYDAQQKG